MGDGVHRPHPLVIIMATERQRFQLGTVTMTPGAMELIEDWEVDIPTLIARHVSGDWGELDAHDTMANEVAVRSGLRILSSYQVGNGEPDCKLWIITEADRSYTTILLPEEY